MLNFTSIPVTCFSENCTFIYSSETRRAAICDPGGDFDVIRNKITELKLKPEQILLTHGHLDHIGAVRELIDLYQIPVYGPHEDDLFLINAIEKQSHMLRLPPAGEFKPEKFAKDRETINVAGEDFLVLHCPGHTPGHVVYYATESKFCLTGDVIFQSSIGRTDFPKQNFQSSRRYHSDPGTRSIHHGFRREKIQSISDISVVRIIQNQTVQSYQKL